MNADGSDQHRVTIGANPDEGPPGWSADGKRLLFASIGDTSNSICDVRTDGTDLRCFSSDDTYNAAPAWSPDGRLIAFLSERGQPLAAVFIMEADGSRIRQLTERGFLLGSVSWAPH